MIDIFKLRHVSDEDARADRSPGEFYQLDMEMSFVEHADVFIVIEKLLINLFLFHLKNTKKNFQEYLSKRQWKNTELINQI